MGFTSYSTAPSPTVLFSWAAMRALGGLGSGAGRCMKGALPPSCTNNPAACQSPLLWFCLLTEGGVIPVHLQNTDPSGALSNNGVPLEPGPNYPSSPPYNSCRHAWSLGKQRRTVGGGGMTRRRRWWWWRRKGRRVVVRGGRRMRGVLQPQHNDHPFICYPFLGWVLET